MGFTLALQPSLSIKEHAVAPATGANKQSTATARATVPGDVRGVDWAGTRRWAMVLEEACSTSR
jgi:hypothetical protein